MLPLLCPATGFCVEPTVISNISVPLQPARVSPVGMVCSGINKLSVVSSHSKPDDNTACRVYKYVPDATFSMCTPSCKLLHTIPWVCTSCMVYRTSAEPVGSSCFDGSMV